MVQDIDQWAPTDWRSVGVKESCDPFKATRRAPISAPAGETISPLAIE